MDDVFPHLENHQKLSTINRACITVVWKCREGFFLVKVRIK